MIPQKYFDKVKKYFNGDTDKTWEWFRYPNPSFSGLSPLDMIKMGRQNKLKQFIDAALKENERL